LARELTIDAVATDGIIEAFSRKSRESFFLGLQWHPEWQVNENKLYRHILKHLVTPAAYIAMRVDFQFP